MRVMTFNLRVRTFLDFGRPWRKRRAIAVDVVRRFDPDLLGVQECLADMADELRAALPDYAFLGAGRGDGRRRGEMSAIFFRADRFEQLDGGHFWLSDTPAAPGSRGWGEPFPRMVTWATLRPRSAGDDAGGDPFTFANTHFAVLSARARERSAGMLRDWLARVTGDGAAPAVVTGDFNAGEGSIPYVTLVGERAGGNVIRPPLLFDAYRAVHPERRPDEGTSHHFRGRRSGARIDWVLATHHFEATRAEILDHRDPAGRYPSDHFPVGVELRRAPVPPLA